MKSENMIFEHGTQTIEFHVKRTDRKTIWIGIEAPDTVKVVAPKGLPDELLLSHIKKKAKWIVTKLSEVREVQHLRAKKEFVNGESFLYLGRSFSLQIEIDETIKKPLINLFQEEFLIVTPTKNQEALKQSMELWYREKTYKNVVEKVNYFQQFFEVKPNNIKVKEQKKRWASCSSQRNLNFNWRCSMAPSSVLDYIVLHEMCHMMHMNHSKEFWDLIERIMPDYKKRREWLKMYGFKLEL